MATKSIIVIVRFTPDDISKIDAALSAAIQKPHHGTITRSGWIRSVVLAYLGTKRKLRSKGRALTFRCEICGKKRVMDELSSFMTTLDGGRVSYCIHCQPLRTPDKTPPL